MVLITLSNAKLQRKKIANASLTVNGPLAKNAFHHNVRTRAKYQSVSVSPPFKTRWVGFGANRRTFPATKFFFQ